MNDPAAADAVDVQQLQARALHYAKRAGAADETIQRLKDFLAQPLTQAVLALPTKRLHMLLVNDLYKYRMQQMYSQFMTGVSADFALNIRKCSGRPASQDYLSDLQARHPRVYQHLLQRVGDQLVAADPLHPMVREVLQEYAGFTPCEALLQRCKAHGVVPVQQGSNSNGHASLFAMGPVEAASNTETTCMQAVQEALIQGQVEELLSSQQQFQQQQQQQGLTQQQRPQQPQQQQEQEHTQQRQQQQQGQCPCEGSVEQGGQQQGGVVLSRSERLANSLGRLAAVVQQLNDLPHSFQILLMAGRRSTDLLHLLLQNLYFMQHCRGYLGTSAVMAVALLHPLLTQHSYSQQQRQQLVGRLAGTHAHEMTSMVQQLMVPFDHKAGQLAGLQAPVCISQLLAPLLFLLANGDAGPAAATSLSDTFTTRSFLAAALAADVPPTFVEDMRAAWSWDIPAGSKVFDLFRVWRLDSGDYADVAAAVVDAWEGRCSQLVRAGRQPLPQPQLMHSNLSSVQEIQQLLDLPERIRPVSLGFGGLADGFLPFDPPTTHTAAAAARAPAGTTPPEPPQQAPLVQACSLVMKAVQARLVWGPPAAVTDGNGGSTASAADNTRSSSQLEVPAAVQQSQTCRTEQQQASSNGGNASHPPAVTDQPGAAVAPDAGHQRQACAVKLGDDAALSKVQVDPRLPQQVQQQVLRQMKQMVEATAGVTAAQHGAVLSRVLEEAYVAVVKQGCLQATAGG